MSLRLVLALRVFASPPSLKKRNLRFRLAKYVCTENNLEVFFVGIEHCRGGGMYLLGYS